MSTWISDRIAWRAAAALVPALLLAGCLGAGTGVTRGTTLTVADRPVVIAGPPGFCVDPRATRATGGNAFVLLGNCAAITGSAHARQPDLQALLTATIAESDRPDTIAASGAELSDFFRSRAGRRALSRSGRAETVRVLETFQQGGAFFVHATDSSNALAPGMADDYWRVYFDLDGRIISASVLGFAANPLPRGASLSALRDFERNLRRQNPAVQAAAPANPAPESGGQRLPESST